jgi:LPXTG-site transpeptidase (sortase) family protein
VPASLARRGRSSARLRRALASGAIATLLAALLVFVGSNVFASLAQRDLAQRWDAARAHPAAHLPPHTGDPVARLRIAGAGVDAIVVEGPASSTQRAPVHRASTALPGRSGVSVIEAGRLGFGSFFAWLDRVAPGDEVAVQGFDGIVVYHVIDVRRLAREEIDVNESGDAAILMLIAPASRLGGGDRIVVRAKAEA